MVYSHSRALYSVQRWFVPDGFRAWLLILLPYQHLEEATDVQAHRVQGNECDGGPGDHRSISARLARFELRPSGLQDLSRDGQDRLWAVPPILAAEWRAPSARLPYIGG